MPRPTKLSPQRQAQICEYVAQGHSREIAAQACGITATTVYRWMKRGETEPDGPFGEFCMALKRADAEAEIASLRIISAAAESGVWQAAAWKLERRYPKKWGRRRLGTPAQSKLIVECADWFEERVSAAEKFYSGN